APVPTPGPYRSLREPRVRNPLPRSTLDRPPSAGAIPLSRVISSIWSYWTGISVRARRIGNVLPNDWAAVYFSGTHGTLVCRIGAAAARAASVRTGLRRGSGLARGLRFSRRKRFCAFAARQQKDIAMHTSIGAVAQRPFARRLLAATAGLAFGLAAARPAKAPETIQSGILHSLSRT